ncbi:prolipoprotein diacylglyceryl transferase [Candidatus Peregrinibacteria bacterium]|nr:prolipoprotein diacylglyceryl transferase [Candidatus Peregrinibacteria bacterium]
MLPVLFQYGPFTLRSFDIFLACGFIFSIFFLMRYSVRKKINFSFLSNNLLIILGIGIFLGRILFFLEHFSLLWTEPWRILFIWDLNFSFFGVIYGCLIALFIYCKKNRENFWAWLDAFTLAGLVFLFFLSLGNFFEGSNYGLPTDLPWGILFNNIDVPFAIPIHPTQLYLALAAFAVFSYLMRYNKRHHQPGIVGTAGIMIMGLLLLGLDFLHGIPSFYLKANATLLAVVAFGGFIFCGQAASPLQKFLSE